MFLDTGIPDAPDTGLDARADGSSDDATIPPWEDECTAEGMGATLGTACVSHDQCNDGCFCNGTEICSAGMCAAGSDPCVDSIECTQEACLEETDQCFFEPDHASCSDMNACNGQETCDRVRGCLASAPLYCNDEDSCTVDSCDAISGCEYTPRDLDGDGFVAGSCGGMDCDDDPRFGTMIYPGAMEDCTNRRDDNCDGLRDYTDPTCVPANDTCDTAVVLPGPGTYSGSLRALTSDYTLSCGSSSGGDAVFRFTLAMPQDVRITIAGAGTGTSVAVRPWASCAAGPDEKCYDGNPPNLLRRSLPAGDWAIIVKGSSGNAFDLTLMLGPPTEIPPVDVCGPMTEDITAAASMAGGTTVMGMFNEVEDDYRLSCAGTTSRRDAVYKMVLTAPKAVTIRASTTGGSFSSTYLSLTTDCSSTAGQQCISGSPAMITRRDLAAGTYYIMIESSSTTPSAWSATVTITDPVVVLGDACSMPIDISPAAGATTGSGMINLATVVGDGGTSCGSTSSSARDAVFSYTLTETRNVRLATSAAGSTHWVSVNGACPRSAASPDLRCQSGSGTLNQLLYSQPAGTYYVVMSTTRTSGTATINLTLEAPTTPPANDICSGAEVLVSPALATGTLVGMADDVRGRLTSAPDVFYTFTLTARSTVSMSISDGTASGTVYAVLRSNCTTTTNLASVFGNPASILETLDAGTYIVVVEKTASTVSPITVTYTAFPAP
jgi:hypothetical protein